MDFFDILTMLGGLCLFLFGMNIMGDSLERRAGGSLRTILGKLTTNKMLGFLTGLVVTGIIQSSSATTVMVVGFVNSGLMTLEQAINVIMGANVGTTVTAWILSLSGVNGDGFLIQMLKPTSFSPILALIGVVFYVFCKDGKKKDTGMILLGFATLMFGMDTMSDAVSGLRNEVWFQNMFIMFQNPILGVLAGAVLTGIIQSSSASVGILQALSTTGQITMGAAIPIIMGQNIGTCVTALLSSVGTNKNARRAALVHLSFNVIGTVVWLALFSVLKAVIDIPMLSATADGVSIAVAHSVFNILCTVLLLPLSRVLEKVAYLLIPETKEADEISELDERLLTTPPVALERCRNLTSEMAAATADSVNSGIAILHGYTPELAAQIKKLENRGDHYEDILGSYLVKLSALQISEADSGEAATLLKVIGDFERISDHCVNLMESAEELSQKKLKFSETANGELDVMLSAVREIVDLSFRSFTENDPHLALQVEPLEQVIDDLKEKMRTRHILRLQQGSCSIETGFIWSDLLTSLERIGDHCSNIAGCVIDLHHHDMNIHESLRALKAGSPDFKIQYQVYSNKYNLA